MTFQSSVNFQQGLGVIGEFYSDTPRRTQSYILESIDATNNVFGRGFSFIAEGKARAGSVGLGSLFAGILVNPKASALVGDGVNPLNPSLTLPNEAQGELCTMGSVIVTLPAVSEIGWLIVYDNNTGALSAINPTTVLPAGTQPAYAFVDYFRVDAAGLAVITLEPSLTYVLV